MRRVAAAILGLAMAIVVPVIAQQGGTSLAKDSRVFEMRTYYAVPGRVEDMHARFRAHTSGFFQKHGMTIVGYWVPIDEKSGEVKGNTLVYILAYPDMEARQKAWQAFGNDPGWQKAKADSEKNGKIVEKVESVFLKATDYSPIE
jgi:hypothetical protein